MSDASLLLLLAIPGLIGAGYLAYEFRRIGQPAAWGVASGALAGALGPLIFMLPLDFCTFEPGRTSLDVLIGVVLAAAGAALALAHPLTILSAFLAAPITTLHPLLAAGWVAGIVQAFVRRPTVSDFEDLPEAIGSLKGFWTNPVTRILLIIALANVGAMIGVPIAGAWIAARSV